MSIGIGYLIAGWITYIISYIAKVTLHLKNPKIYGNAAAIASMTVITVVALIRMRHSHQNLNRVNVSLREKLFFFLLFTFILTSMFYVFHIKNGMLQSGVSVFSDYSPHTAMIQSFAVHDNFPTQYPHYGGADVKYHFMFQFFTGNLVYLGMRIDWAFNLTSAAALWGFLVLLYYFAKRLTNHAAVGVISIFMFFFRSSFAALGKLAETILSGDWHGFFTNTDFIGYTAHEDWGLWNYNVFLNQRHLGFGLLIAMIVITYFSSYLNWLDIYKGKGTLKAALFHKTSWTICNWKMAAVMGFLLGALAFWNGAVVVAALLILFGFAVVSEHKLDYLITAIIAVVLSSMQKNFFTDSSVGQNIGVSYQFGFLANECTLPGTIKYIILLSGIFFLGILFFLIFFKGKKRAITAACMIPVVFAFTVSMTPDIAVNHKYIIISTIFLNIMWADVIVRLWNAKKEQALAKSASVLLAFLLMCTGMYDMLTIYNQDKDSVNIAVNSKVTEWLEQNTTESDLILTGQDCMSDVTLSGAMLYCGWPYYAWSAGYDTDYRGQQAKMIYTTDDKNVVKNTVEAEHIDYIVYHDGMVYDDAVCRNDVIESLYPCVFNDGLTKIYKAQE